MSILREKEEERGRLLLIFSGTACVRKHLNGFRDRECRICLEKEAIGILADEEFSLIWEKGTYWLEGQALDSRKPYYYYTGQKERLLLLLSKEQTTLDAGEKLMLQTEETFRIGNAYPNQIFYDCYSLIKPQMAEIFYTKDGYVIRPKKDEGIYVNERILKEEQKLHTGDRIDIYGLHMIILKEILFCCSYVGIFRAAGGQNRPQKAVLSQRRLPAEKKQSGGGEWIERYCRQEESLHEGEVELLMPETVNREKSTPLFLSLGPSVTMVLPMLLMAWMGSRMMQQNGSGFYLLSVVMSISSAFLAFFWGIVNHGYRRHMRKREEKGRVLQYQEYLKGMRETLLNCAAENRRILEQRYPPATAFLAGEESPARVAWNRYFRHPDFLFLRLGVGETNFQLHVKLSGEQKRIVPDNLSQTAHHVAEEFQNLRDVPVGVNFSEVRQLGILGDTGEEEMREILFQLLVQLAACHCYTEVKFACFYRKEKESHEKLVEGIKWLRHSWSADGKVRLLAGDEKEAAQVLPVLQREMEKGEEGKGALPWYLVLVLHEELVRGEILYRHLIDTDSQYPVSTVFIKEIREELPKSCRYCLSVQKQEAVIYGEEQIVRKPIALERVRGSEAQDYLRAISGLRVKEAAAEMQLPEKISFLQMYGCTRVEELAGAVRWKKNNPRERLKVPIGAGAGGNPVWLDVHEKFHGPHGLIAGTTGSGKSELLQTYLLSLSVNYSPEDINFFMIDYKGGGTGNSLQRLPHCAGVISNLSGKQIKRAMSAITSENKRRQQLLSSYGVNHIDAYTELYRGGKAGKPMPHLLLVVDEFAELRREEPEFMQDMVSLAQVGRSLGVHLILATQKPAGTVDDRIWSNARFRLCLRVQDQQDSLDVLHNKDAAMLTVPGQCYLQIGNQEYYELFQTGYCGEDYQEEADRNSGAELVEITGVHRHRRRRQEQKEKRSQLEVVIDYVNQIAKQEGYEKADELWMPELPEAIYLDELVEIPEKSNADAVQDADKCENNPKKGEIRLLLGICDDPENQRQFTFEYCPKEQGHLAVLGGPASGKSFLLHTILWQLCTGFSPEEAVILAVDTGQGSMEGFSAMPSCLGMLRGREAKEIFFYHLKRFVAERKKLLSGISAEQYNKTGKRRIPYAFLAVDNFGAFFQILDEEQQEFMVRLAAEGIYCGIYLILAGAAPGEIPGKMYEKIKTTMALEMSDRFAYGDVLRQYYIPVLPKENIKGRGLCKIDGKILEFQTALAVRAPDEYARIQTIRKTGQALRVKWEKTYSLQEKGEIPLNYFPEIPVEPDFETLKNAVSKANKVLPIGYSLTSGEIIKVKIGKHPCFLVSGAGHAGKEAVLETILEGLLWRKENAVFIDTERKMEHVRNKNGVQFFSGEEEILLLHRRLREGSCILITDLPSFCRLIYRMDEGREERTAFWESTVQGKEKGFFLAAGYTPARNYEAEATRFFQLFSEWQIGIHLGGNGAGQHIFSFEDLGYAELNQSESAGVGYYKNGLGSRTEKVLLPERKEEKDDIS